LFFIIRVDEIILILELEAEDLKEGM